MMKMATREGFPPLAGCRNGSRLVFGEACGGGTPDLGFFLEVLGYIRGVGVGDKSGGFSRQPRGRGARPPPSWWPQDSPGPSSMLRGLLLVQK